MMKRMVGMVAILLLVTGLLWPHATHAVALTIEGGFVANAGDPADTGYVFGGEGFTVQGVVQGQLAGFGALTSGVFTVPFVGLIGNSTVTVDGVGTCIGPDLPIVDACGFITLNSTPVTPPDFTFPLTSPYAVSVPFTAGGHLNVGDGFDIIGDGTLFFEYCPGLCGGFPTPTAIYIFATPEPSTLLLVGVAFSIASIRARRIRRG